MPQIRIRTWALKPNRMNISILGTINTRLVYCSSSRLHQTSTRRGISSDSEGDSEDAVNSPDDNERKGSEKGSNKEDIPKEFMRNDNLADVSGSDNLKDVNASTANRSNESFSKPGRLRDISEPAHREQDLTKRSEESHYENLKSRIIPRNRQSPSFMKQSLKVPSPRELKNYLDKYAIGQDQAKKYFSVAVFNHYLRILDRQIRENDAYDRMSEEVEDKSSFSDTINNDSNDEAHSVQIEKSNILILGPTGSGKSMLARVLAKAIDIPFAITDCTSLTQAGYVGDDVDVCIHRLAQAADWDPERIESGIVVLDEFDKLAKMKSTDNRRDVSGEGVQQALLKLVEGVDITIPTPPQKTSPYSSYNSGSSKSDQIVIDTSNILFIFMGAFTGLEKFIQSRYSSVRKPKISFDNLLQDRFEEFPEEDSPIVTLRDGREIPALELVAHDDLVSFGIIPELAGRIPVLVPTNELTAQELKRVLIEPRNSIIKQHESLFSQWGVQLSFTETALGLIAETAYTKGIGARGLSSIISQLLVEPNFESPNSGTRYILINEEVVRTMNEVGGRKIKPMYYSSYQKVKFLNDIEKEDPELAQEMNARLFPYKTNDEAVKRKMSGSG